jgi:Bacterial extracellular solute-binding protein
MTDNGPKLTILGRIFILIFIAGCGCGAFLLFNAGRSINQSPNISPTSSSKIGPDNAVVEIGVAYGTEKQRWLEWTLGEFQKSESGKKIRVNLIPMGSLEGAQAILRGDRRINVWSPASSLYVDVFNQEWQLKNSNMPILRQEQLALPSII